MLVNLCRTIPAINSAKVQAAITVPPSTGDSATPSRAINICDPATSGKYGTRMEVSGQREKIGAPKREKPKITAMDSMFPWNSAETLMAMIDTIAK